MTWQRKGKCRENWATGATKRDRRLSCDDGQKARRVALDYGWGKWHPGSSGPGWNELLDSDRSNTTILHTLLLRKSVTTTFYTSSIQSICVHPGLWVHVKRVIGGFPTSSQHPACEPSRPRASFLSPQSHDPTS